MQAGRMTAHAGPQKPHWARLLTLTSSATACWAWERKESLRAARQRQQRQLCERSQIRQSCCGIFCPQGLYAAEWMRPAYCTRAQPSPAQPSPAQPSPARPTGSSASKAKGKAGGRLKARGPAHRRVRSSAFCRNAAFSAASRSFCRARSSRRLSAFWRRSCRSQCHGGRRQLERAVPAGSPPLGATPALRGGAAKRDAARMLSYLLVLALD